MAECTHNSIIVSGAGLASVNGTYIKAGTNTVKGETFSVFTQDGNESVPKIYVRGINGNEDLTWAIFANTGGFGNQDVYLSPIYDEPIDTPSCPTGINWQSSGGPWGSFSPFPTVAAVAAAPATVTFPASPALNDIHTVGTRSWKYNGTAWKLVPKTTDSILEGSSNLYYTDARVAAAPAVTALETRAGTIESAATTLAGRVTTAEGSITTLTSGLATEKGRVDAILSASEADKDSFAEIVSLINSVDTTNDTAFGTYVTNNNAAVSAVEGRATTLEGEMDAAEGRLNTVESDISAIESSATSLTGRVDTAESDITALETRAGTIESAATTLAGRVTTAESDIDALETGKQIKNVISATAPSHVAGLIWIDSTDMSSYVSYGSAWVELDKA